MILTVVLLLFFSFVAWLLYRFPLPKAQTPQEYRKLMLFFGVVAVFLLFSAFLAYLGRSGLLLAAKAAPVTTLAQLRQTPNQEGVIVAGAVSADNEKLYGDAVAYVDDTHLWSPKPLWISLSDGDIPITNDTYQATAWQVDARQFSILPPGEPVTIMAYLENLTDPNSGEESPALRAEIIYRGSPEAFAARAKGKVLLATVMASLNLLAALVVIFIPMRDCMKGIQSHAE